MAFSCYLSLEKSQILTYNDSRLSLCDKENESPSFFSYKKTRNYQKEASGCKRKNIVSDAKGYSTKH